MTDKESYIYKARRYDRQLGLYYLTKLFFHILLLKDISYIYKLKVYFPIIILPHTIGTYVSFSLVLYLFFTPYDLFFLYNLLQTKLPHCRSTIPIKEKIDL